MEAAIYVAAMAAFAAAAWGDLRRRQIPNALALTLAGLGLARMALAGDPVAAGWTFLAGATVLAAGFGLFSFGLIGGGDAKLLSAATLLVGAHALPLFLLVMSLAGGVVALALLAHRKLSPWLGVFAVAALAHRRLGAWCANRPRLERALATIADGPSRTRKTVPYGVAIAAAGIVILSLQLSV